MPSPASLLHVSVSSGEGWGGLFSPVNYYNEHDPKAAAWLRELIAQNLIPEGVVDERSIEDVRPSELLQYIQCHFFAGIGGWPLALSLAGWPDSKPIWTGSCPCQPFSTAGEGKGIADERHLWPAFKWHVQQCRPPVVAGEQVASKDGREWLAGVRADLEDLGYAVGASDLCAASVGSPHIRQRLFWVADSHNAGPQGWKRGELRECADQRPFRAGSASGGMADSSNRAFVRFIEGNGKDHGPERREGCCSSFWAGTTVRCRDGKTRRIPAEPALFPLADGLPGRVGLLRGAGNAIVPQVAAEFIKAYTEAICLD